MGRHVASEVEADIAHLDFEVKCCSEHDEKAA